MKKKTVNTFTHNGRNYKFVPFEQGEPSSCILCDLSSEKRGKSSDTAMHFAELCGSYACTSYERVDKKNGYFLIDETPQSL